MKTILRCTLFALAAGLIVVAPAAADSNPAKELCKNGGYATFSAPGGGAFKNQGQCVAFVNHGGTLVPLAPPPTIAQFVDGSVCFSLSGTGFTGATAVTIDGTPVASFTVVSDSLITGVPATPAAGVRTISVTTPGGTAGAAADLGAVCGGPSGL